MFKIKHEVLTIVWTINEIEYELIEMTIGSRGISKGRYFVILQTPTVRKAEKMEIIK